jgi:hypothetical protein
MLRIRRIALAVIACFALLAGTAASPGRAARPPRRRAPARSPRPTRRTEIRRYASVPSAVGPRSALCSVACAGQPCGSPSCPRPTFPSRAKADIGPDAGTA